MKASLRRPANAEIDRHRDEETERWLDTWFSDAGQKLLAAAVQRIKK